jgi:hypothetical protein
MSDTLADLEISYKLLYMHKALTDAGLPIVSVRLDKSIVWATEPTPTEEATAASILAAINLDTLEDMDKSRLKTEYQNTLVQLQQIDDATNPTNAQVIAAVKFLANTLRLVLKLFARQFIN